MMDEKMFLEPEYVEALRLLVDCCGLEKGFYWGKPAGKAFLIHSRYYQGDSSYVQDIYVMPDKRELLLMTKISGGKTYENSRVVPAVVKELIENWRAKGELLLIEWPINIDKIEAPDLKRTHVSFGYWAVKKVPIQGMDVNTFYSILKKYSFETDDLSEKFGDLYRQF